MPFRNLSNLVILFVFMFSSCQISSDSKVVDQYQCPMKCEGEKTYESKQTCPVCRMNLELVSNGTQTIHNDNEIKETSIFNLNSTWNTQHGEQIKLLDLKGDILVVVMVYTSCKSACPRLMADMRNIYAEVPDKSVKYVLVSIDPETDTPERLKKVAMENKMDTDQWIFLQGTESSVREFANVLAVRYKKISPIDFSHSNIISVFDTDGVLHFQQEGLGVSNVEIVRAINQLSI